MENNDVEIQTDERGERKTGRNCEKAAVRDWQREPVFGWCRWCGGEIYVGQSYYEPEDGKICADCLPDYAKSYFLSVLRTAMPRGGRI